jgi:hypothetical protein
MKQLVKAEEAAMFLVSFFCSCILHGIGGWFG